MLGLSVALALARDSFRSGFRHVLDIENALAFSRSRQSHSSRRITPAGFQGRGSTAPATAFAKRGGRGVPVRRDSIASSRRLASLVLNDPDSVYAESIRTLYFALKRQAEGSPIGAIMVTSALPGEGKSTIAASLARIATESGDRVLLIDSDLRHPRIANILALEGECGLPEALRDPTDLTACVQYDPHSELYVIGGYHRVPGREALRLLSSKHMTRMLKLARESFDFVVVDRRRCFRSADPRARRTRR